MCPLLGSKTPPATGVDPRQSPPADLQHRAAGQGEQHGASQRVCKVLQHEKGGGGAHHFRVDGARKA